MVTIEGKTSSGSRYPSPLSKTFSFSFSFAPPAFALALADEPAKPTASPCLLLPAFGRTGGRPGPSPPGYAKSEKSEHRSTYSKMSSSRPRKCPQHITKSICLRSILRFWVDGAGSEPPSEPSNGGEGDVLGGGGGGGGGSFPAGLEPPPFPTGGTSTISSTSELDPHSPIMLTIRSTAAPLLTPIGRTSTDFAP